MAKVFRLSDAVGTDDWSKIQVLTLPSNAKDDTPVTFHDSGGSDYQVPANTLFISISALMTIPSGEDGRVGESDAGDGALTREVLYIKDATGGQLEMFGDAQMIGVFRAGKYVTAESTHSITGIASGAVLIGVEVSTA